MPANEVPWLTLRNTVLLMIGMALLCFICDGIKCRNSTSGWCVGPVRYRCKDPNCEGVGQAYAMDGYAAGNVVAYFLDIGPSVTADEDSASLAPDTNRSSLTDTVGAALKTLARDSTLWGELVGDDRRSVTAMDRIPLSGDLRAASYLTELKQALPRSPSAHVLLTRYLPGLAAGLEEAMRLRQSSNSKNSLYLNSKVHVFIFLYQSLGTNPDVMGDTVDQVRRTYSDAVDYTRRLLSKTLSEAPRFYRHISGASYLLVPPVFPAAISVNTTDPSSYVCPATQSNSSCTEACESRLRSQRLSGDEVNAQLLSAFFSSPLRSPWSAGLVNKPPLIALSRNTSNFHTCAFWHSDGLRRFAEIVLTPEAWRGNSG